MTGLAGLGWDGDLLELYGASHFGAFINYWRLLLNISLVLSTKEINPITRKSMSNFVTQFWSCRQKMTSEKWQTFGKIIKIGINVWQ